MNPLLAEALGSILRSLLKIGAGYLVARGVWSQADATTYVAAAALALVGLGWSYWTTYASRLKLVTALSIGGQTEAHVAQAIAANGPLPSVTTASTAVPVALPPPVPPKKESA